MIAKEQLAEWRKQIEEYHGMPSLLFASSVVMLLIQEVERLRESLDSAELKEVANLALYKAEVKETNRLRGSHCEGCKSHICVMGPRDCEGVE